MGNNSSYIKPEPTLEISGPLHLLSRTSLPQVDEEPQEQGLPYEEDEKASKRAQERVNQRAAKKVMRSHSVPHHPTLAPRPEASIQRTRSHTRKTSMPDRPTFLPEIPHVTLDLESQDQTFYKQIEAHAVVSSAANKSQSDFFYSPVFGYGADSRSDPYEELAASRINSWNERNCRQPSSDSTAGKRPYNQQQQPPATSPYSSALNHKNSTASLLSFGSIRSRTSRTSRTSISSIRRGSEPTFELVIPPGSLDDSANSKNQSIIVTTKTRVQYDVRNGEWQFDVDVDDADAKVVEPESLPELMPEPEPKTKRIRRILRTLS